MAFKKLDDIDLINEAYYLVKGENLSRDGYVVAQAQSIYQNGKYISGLVVYEKKTLNNIDIEGIMKLK